MESRALEPLPHRERDVAKPYEPNFILAWLYRVFFSRIDVDPLWIRAVREASARGTVVYVMRSRSYLDFVALDFFLKKFSLPLVRFVSDLGMWILEPMGRGLRSLFRRREPEGPALQRAIAAGHSALLFMRKPQAPTAFKRRGERADVDHIRILIEQQRRQKEPILLVPQVFVWGKQPDRLHKGVVDQIFGPREYPGRLRIFAQFLWNFQDTKLRACEPLDLKAFLEAHGDLPDEALVNKIHWLLVTRLDRERRVVIGPMAKTPDRLAQEILRNPRVRKAAAEAAARENKDLALIERQVRADLERMEARPNALLLGIAAQLFHWVFSRIYQGIEIDEQGLQRIREQARRGPIVLLPSHKSHIDYLLLSYVFYSHGIQCPLIAAGDNLAFWPAGPILRRWGAFFIKRKFGGQRLYTTIVDAYVRKLLKEGYAIEFFVEGGRSRSGKLLPPKAGLLSMVADAAETGGLDVAYVPIAIGYERIVEQRSYVEELTGAEKKKEDAGALLKAPRVLLAKYGRAYIQVGEILHFTPEGKVLTGQSLPPPAPAPSSEAQAATGRAAKRAMIEKMHARRNAISALAQRVAYEINRVTPVTPPALVATVLLANRRRGTLREDLLAGIDALVLDLQRSGARFASSLATGYAGSRRPYRVDAIDQAINLLADAGLVVIHGPAGEAIYHVPDDKRLALDYYKNNLIHFFVPRALVANALLASPGASSGRTRTALRERFVWLAKVLSHEFQFRREPSAEFDAALAGLVESGELVFEGEGEDARVSASSDQALEQLRFQAGLVRNFLESHRIAVRALSLLLRGTMPAKDLLKKSLALGERMYLAGEVLQREAVSKPNLENAFAALRESGVLVGGDGGPQRLVAPHDTEAALREMEQRLMAYL